MYYTTYETTSTMPQISPVVWIFYIAIMVFELVALWKLYAKAGQPGWAAIVPIYNMYIWLKIVKMEWWHLLIMLFVPCAIIVYACILNYKTAMVFGKDTGFGVLCIFFSNIMIPILAFGSSEYVG